ncbi:hypothetical protein ACOMHN_016086 [Nucella lapillus]
MAVLHLSMLQVVLQQLCSLPFQYFSDPHLTAVLLPALISCCYNNHSNRRIVEQEISSVSTPFQLHRGCNLTTVNQSPCDNFRLQPDHSEPVSL